MTAQSSIYYSLSQHSSIDYGPSKPFLEACMCGQLWVVKTMKHLININVNSYGDTGLMNASWYGRIDVVRYLIENGAIIDSSNYHGSTALLWAAINGQLDIIKILVKSGANIYITDRNCSIARLEAPKYGHHKIGQFLTHCEIIDVTLALSPMELSPYVLLWILQWIHNFKDSAQLRVLRLIEGIHTSILAAKC